MKNLYASGVRSEQSAQIDAPKLIKFAYQAGHGSIFEHVSLSMNILGISRAFLAQITRHRHASFTSSSQHYQDYRDYPVVTSDAVLDQQALKSVKAYADLVEEGYPHDEARQVLPNASAVALTMTANAREWAHILNLRMCERNTQETIVWAMEAHGVLMEWFPELFRHVGPDCFQTECRQGGMSPCK